MSYELPLIILLSFLLSLSLIKQYQNRKALSGTKKELEDIFNRVIIMHFDLNGKILKVSDAYENIFGYSKKDLVGITIDKNYCSPSKPSRPIWKFLEEKGEFSGEMQLFDTEGKPYWMHKQIIKKYTQGNHSGFISISHDITAIKLYQEQQRRIVDQSRHALMGEMISMIAHQWRQPLAALSSIIANIRLESELERLQREVLHHKLQDSEKIIQHLSTTLNEFRNFFKNDKLKKEIKLHDLVNESCKLIDFKLQDIQVINNIDKEFVFSTLQGEYLQIILNLISNAADALKDIQNPKITLALQITEKDIIFEVNDNGQGIKEDIIDSIFDPYFSTKSKNGTGLGLYICKTILQEHLNGEIKASSKEGSTSFKIITPR